MKLTFIGGDKRTIYQVEYLNSKGYETETYGLSNKADGKSLCSVIENSDALVLPLPLTKDGKTVFSPMSNQLIFIEDIIMCRPKIVLGGLIPKQISELFSKNGIMFYDYYTSEKLTIKNAMLTAEAAIALAISKTEISLFDSNALVIGYGRIGKLLSKYLKALGANVTATSRSEDKLALITTDGITALKTEEIEQSLDKYDYIFNTVPAPVMNDVFFSKVKKYVFIADLATNAGTDFLSAEQLKINAESYPGLPGKYFPKTAGYFVGEEIYDFLRRTL